MEMAVYVITSVVLGGLGFGYLRWLDYKRIEKDRKIKLRRMFYQMKKAFEEKRMETYQLA